MLLGQRDQIVFAVILIGIGGLYAMLATGLVTALKGSGVINRPRRLRHVHCTSTTNDSRARS
jgi:hypothetical protein